MSDPKLGETLTAKNNDILPRTPYARPKSEIYTPKRDDEHPRTFHIGLVPRRRRYLGRNAKLLPTELVVEGALRD